MVSVPDAVGASVDDARKTLEDAGFQVNEDRGLLGLFGTYVKSQSVEGGRTAPKGSTISIDCETTAALRPRSEVRRRAVRERVTP